MRILANRIAAIAMGLVLICAPVAAEAQRGGGGHGGGGGGFRGGGGGGFRGGGGWHGGTSVGGGFRGGGGGVYRGGGYRGGVYRGGGWRGGVYRGGYGWGGGWGGYRYGYPGWGWRGYGFYGDPWLWGWSGYGADYGYPAYDYDVDPAEAPPVPQGSVDSYGQAPGYTQTPAAPGTTPPSAACGHWQWGEDKQYHWITANGCQ